MESEIGLLLRAAKGGYSGSSSDKGVGKKKKLDNEGVMKKWKRNANDADAEMRWVDVGKEIQKSGSNARC